MPKSITTPARPWFVSIALLFGAAFTVPAQAQTGVTFSKQFSPNPIGPGSVTTLTFTIASELSTPVTDLAFTDTLPGAVTIADPAFATDGCNGTVSAPAGGSTITYSGGSVDAFSSCQISVDVTGTLAGEHQNVSGDLTSSAGNSGPATATLSVDSGIPSFFKSFAPASVQLGGDTTLTLTIDNTANDSAVTSASFTDQLPSGLRIAEPANAVTDCGEQFATVTLTASAGSSRIELFASGSSVDGGRIVPAGATCSVAVDVTTDATGTLANRSGNLTTNFGASGKASDSLAVTADTLALDKDFTDDPATPGGVVTLAFSITNFDRSQTATNIAFTDDLDATLDGLFAIPPLPSEPCGVGSTLDGDSLLTLSDGTLGPGETCSFEVTLQVSAGATPGSFPNTTSEITGNFDGTAVTGSPAEDELFVAEAPILSKTFLSEPVGAGGSVDLEFNIVNTSTSSTATDIAFTDDLGAAIPGLSASALPADGFCGASSTIVGTNVLSVTGATLPAGGSCSFVVTVDVPSGIPTGSFTNTTSEITATVDATSLTGRPASDELVVVAPPLLRKEFTDDPVEPGQTATLTFTLAHDELAPTAATDIAFTDDLDATLTGLVATGLPQTDICGSGSSLSGTSVLSFTGGSLAPGESCTFDVTVQLPNTAPAGGHTNTTTAIAATVDGVSTTGSPATDELRVAAVSMTKDFVDDPVIPGGEVTLSFTISNDNPSADATDIAFQDELESVLPGLTAVALPADGFCGSSASLTGTSVLQMTGGSLAAGTSCTFQVTLSVPADTQSAVYNNTTQSFTATVGGTSLTLPNAQDDLTVTSELLTLDKRFADDPVRPGDTVTLAITLTNTSGSDTVTGIAFTDDLDATLTGLVSESGTQGDVCGAGSELSGTGVLSLTGGQLGPGASCSFSATLRIPSGSAGGAFPNTTSTVTGSVGALNVTGLPATDELLVNLVAFSKAFDAPSIAGGTATLTFTIDNAAGGSGVADLNFQDDLDAVIPGMVATDLPKDDVCGTGSSLTGSSVVALDQGNLDAGGQCSFAVNVQVPAGAAAGDFVNTTTELLDSGVSVAAPASATLRINPPPLFGKAFAPTAIALDGGVSTLTFTIDNTASTAAADGLAFSDDLPAGLSVAATPNASVTCTGGTLTAPAGAGSIGYSGGSVAAGSTCTVSVDIEAGTAGSHANTSGALTSSLGDSGTAQATLSAEPAPGFDKTFSPTIVASGATSTLTFTIDNTQSGLDATGLSFVDELPSTVTVADPANASTTCTGGTLDAVAGSGQIAYSAGSVAAGTSCTVQADVSAGEAGEPTNTSGALTSSLGDSGTASDTLTVVDSGAAVGLEAAFAASPILPGGSVNIEYTITNEADASLSDIAFDHDLGATLAGLAATATPLTDVCGAGSQLTGTGTVSLSGGTLPAGGSCSFTVAAQVPTDAALGSHTGTTSEIAAVLNASPVTGAPAEATLGVAFVEFTKAFATDFLVPGQRTSLSFTLTNPDPVNAASGLSFTDDLDAVLPGLTATGLPTDGVCGADSTLSGTSLIELTGGSLDPGASCSFEVALLIPEEAALGPLDNVTSPLSAVIGGSTVSGGAAGAASDSTEIVFAGPIPTLSVWALTVLSALMLGIGFRHRRLGG